MENAESTHQMAAWAHRPMLFAGCTAALGAVAFGVALLLPIGIPAVALAATGAIAAASGLLTLLILIVAHATGLRQRTEPGNHAAPRPTVQEPAAAAAPRPQIVDEPTQPLVIDLTDDDRVSSASR